MRNSAFGTDSIRRVVDPTPIDRHRTATTILKSSYLVDLTLVAADAPLSSGDNALAQVSVPSNKPVEFQTEFELPTRDTDVRIEVLNEISEDGGATWHPFGGFVREPGPWVDKDGSPITTAGMAQAIADASGNPVTLAPGTIKRSTVKLTKPVSAKLRYLFRPNK